MHSMELTIPANKTQKPSLPPKSEKTRARQRELAKAARALRKAESSMKAAPKPPPKPRRPRNAGSMSTQVVGTGVVNAMTPKNRNIDKRKTRLFSGRDYVGAATMPADGGTPGTLVFSKKINPRLFAQTRLYQESILWESWKIKSLRFVLTPAQGTSAPGSFIAWFDTNADTGASVNPLAEGYGHRFEETFNTWQSASIAYPPDGRLLYCNTAGSGDKFFLAGTFYLYSMGGATVATGTTLFNISVEYEIMFENQQFDYFSTAYQSIVDFDTTYIYNPFKSPTYVVNDLDVEFPSETDFKLPPSHIFDEYECTLIGDVEPSLLQGTTARANIPLAQAFTVSGPSHITIDKPSAPQMIYDDESGDPTHMIYSWFMHSTSPALAALITLGVGGTAGLVSIFKGLRLIVTAINSAANTPITAKRDRLEKYGIDRTGKIKPHKLRYSPDSQICDHGAYWSYTHRSTAGATISAQNLFTTGKNLWLTNVVTSNNGSPFPDITVFSPTEIRFRLNVQGNSTIFITFTFSPANNTALGAQPMYLSSVTDDIGSSYGLTTIGTIGGSYMNAINQEAGFSYSGAQDRQLRITFNQAASIAQQAFRMSIVVLPINTSSIDRFASSEDEKAKIGTRIEEVSALCDGDIEDGPVPCPLDCECSLPKRHSRLRPNCTNN